MLQQFKKAFSDSSKDKLASTNTGLNSVEHSSLSQLIDEASFPIYVCDFDTDELLYMNKQAEMITGKTLEDNPSIKCYECFMNRDTMCPFCNKESLIEESFTGFDAFHPETGEFHRVYGKRIRWQGKNAQIRYINEISGTLNAIPQSERETAYLESLRVRKDYSDDAVAWAHYNLTKDLVCDAKSVNKKWEEKIKEESLDNLFKLIKSDSCFSLDEGKTSALLDRKAMIAMFYRGKTHLCIKQYINGLKGYFEGTFDIMQNPVSFDIEAFVALWDKSEDTISRKIVEKIYSIDYETIVTIDSDTGEAHPFHGAHINDVISEQGKVGSNVGGVESYLREHCENDDVDRVVTETSLPFVKKQLELKENHVVSYCLNQNGKKVYKKVLYTYLDETKKNILCIMHDVSAAFRDSMLQRNRLSEAINTLREVSGMNIARYDLKTRDYYSDHSVTIDLGYGKVIGNVPDVFINDGNVATQSIHVFREFFEALRNGKSASMSPYLRIPGGEFHLFNAYSRIVFDDSKKPDQAIIVFRDVEEIRRETPAFRRIMQATNKRKSNSYVVYSCNLSDDDPPEKVCGELTEPYYCPGAQRYNERISEYSQKYVHPDDKEAYSGLLNKDVLFNAYRHGVRVATIDYREKASDNEEYRWLNLNLEMEQYPDCTDIVIYFLLTKNEQ